MRVKFKTSECDCSICASMCKNPCVPTPEEAQELINRGHKDNLTVWDSYCLSRSRIETVRPKYSDLNGETACTYFNRVSRKCLLHELNLQPLEGRLANHDYMIDKTSKGSGIHEYICSRWDSPLGRELVELIQEQERNDT